MKFYISVPCKFSSLSTLLFLLETGFRGSWLTYVKSELTNGSHTEFCTLRNEMLKNDQYLIAEIIPQAIWSYEHCNRYIPQPVYLTYLIDKNIVASRQHI